MHIQTKFNIGDTVYVCKNNSTKDLETCKICEGEGAIIIKDESFCCPKCHGKREIVLGSKPTIIHSVEDKPYRIVSYRYTVCKDGEILRYKIKQGYEKEKNVTEDEIFAMREEAVKACDDLNMFTTYDELDK